MTVNGINLSMTRGDTESITVSRADGEPFVSGDTVEMTVRKRPESEKILYKKVTEFTEDGKAVIVLNSADTESIPFGGYGYDIQLTFADGTVSTIIKNGSIYFDKEYTYG